MRCAIEVLLSKLVDFKKLKAEYEWFGKRIHEIHEPFPFEVNIAELQQAIAHLQDCGTQPTASNKIKAEIADIATGFQEAAAEDDKELFEDALKRLWQLSAVD